VPDTRKPPLPWLTRASYVATKLPIPVVLADGPLSADDVARRVGSDPGATYRLMRALASSSMLKQRHDGGFALTRVGQKLRSDVAGTMAKGTPPHPGMLLDLEMLVSACGRERTAAEYAELLSRAKFRQSRVVPTAISIVEAVPASLAAACPSTG
jgi:hypothetical protein